MTKSKKSLIISIFTLVLAVAIATTSTYAWFAMTDTPAVEEFELSVTSQDGLYISAEQDSGYKMELSASDLQTNFDFANVKLDAVTPNTMTVYTKADDGAITVVPDYATAEESADGALKIVATGAVAGEVNIADVTPSIPAAIADSYCVPVTAGENEANLATVKEYLTEGEVVVDDKVNSNVVYGYNNAGTLTYGLFFQDIEGNPVSVEPSYTLTTAEPADWATNYTAYFTEAASEYTAVAAGESAPAWTVSTYYALQPVAYYTFDVYFLSTTAYKIFLNNDTDAVTVDTKVKSTQTVKAPLAGNNPAGAAFAKGEAIDSFAAHAVRIGAEGSLNTVVYDPNSAEGWSTVTTTGTLDNGATASGKMAHDIYNDLASSSNQLTAEQTTEKAASTTLNATVDGAYHLTTLEQITDDADARYGYFGDGVNVYGGSVTISIWLEGKDADCFSSIYEDIMNVNISFKGVDVE